MESVMRKLVKNCGTAEVSTMLKEENYEQGF